MKPKKKLVVCSVLLLLLSMGMYGIYRNLNSADKQTLQTTYEFTATVTEVTVTNGAEAYVKIHTEEYGDALRLSSAAAKRMDLTDVCNLHNGQRITFRIENKWLQRFAEADYGEIVALKTEEKEILSLTDYNKYEHESVLPARAAAAISAVVLLLLSLYCFLRLKGTALFAKRK